MANKKIVDVEYAKALRKRLDSKYATKVELSALKDKIFDVIARTYEEDIATDSYVVPSNFDGHGLIESVPCEVKSISGSSKQFNQLISDNFDTVGYWARNRVSMTVNNHLATVVTNSNAYPYAGIYHYFPAGALIKGHKYLTMVKVRYTSGSCSSLKLTHHNITLMTITSPTINTWYLLGGITEQVRENSEPTNGIIIERAYASTSDIVVDSDTMEVKEPMIFDLNLMGLDSITSVDEFKSKYPLDYYAYDSGSIKSVSVSKIESYSSNNVLLGTINLPNGKIDLNGINDIKDIEFIEQENGTYNAVLTRKIGVIDLGTLNWYYNDAYGMYSDILSLAKAPSSDNDSSNIQCAIRVSSHYLGRGGVYASGTSGNKIALTANKRVVISTTETNPTTFKQAMSGIPLYYEKATPTTEVIATGLTREQVAMAFEIGGTIINDNENTEYNAQATTITDFVCKDWSI